MRPVFETLCDKLPICCKSKGNPERQPMGETNTVSYESFEMNDSDQNENGKFSKETQCDENQEPHGKDFVVQTKSKRWPNLLM